MIKSKYFNIHAINGDLNVHPSHRYDNLVGTNSVEPIVMLGEQALSRVGLVRSLLTTLQCSTIYVGYDGQGNDICRWYFNPLALRYEHTKPSPYHPMILEPTRERALIECMLLKEYFNEGILIEGLKDYLYYEENPVEKLHNEAKFWKFPLDTVDYWIKEAEEDLDEG